MNRKTKRNTGRITPRIKGKKSEIIENCLDPQPHWSDWDDWRDGFRDGKDRTLLKSPFMPLRQIF